MIDEDDWFAFIANRKLGDIIEVDREDLVCAKNLVDHLCDGCQNTFACDSIEVCKLTSALKKILEVYLD